MATAASPEIPLSTGRVRGTVREGIRRFAGIPYAEPPIGDLRFAAPRPRAAWDGVRDATAFGPGAPQSPYPGAIGELLSSVTDTGDDMLTVNVWTPEDAAGAPVVLWIHGGAFERGSASLAGYDGATFARDGVVFVSLNYRLGSEGFSVFPDAPRNLGLRDAALGLDWVVREIAAFGGDPARITLMGESAGGALVAALVSRPDTARLVAGAIIQSGPLEATPPEKAGRVTAALAKKLGVPATRAAFAGIPPQKLIDARSALMAGKTILSGVPGFTLTIDPESLPTSPHLALRDAEVPVLIGTNTDEYRLWFTPDALAAITRARAWLLQRVLRVPRQAAAGVRAEWPDASPGEVLGQLITDRLLRAPASEVARARTAPTWLYEFAWQSPVRGLRAAHAVEIAFAFDNLDAPAAHALAGADAPQSLADEMHAAWVRFIRTGDPGWDRFDGRRLTRVFDAASETVPQPRAEIADALAPR